MADRLYSPDSIFSMSRNDFESFFFQVDKKFYEHFFDYSFSLNKHKKLLFAKINIFNDFLYNIDFEANKMYSSRCFLSIDMFKVLLDKVFDFGISNLIIQSSMPLDDYDNFMSIYELLQNLDLNIYYDFGNSTLIKFSEIEIVLGKVFLDYIPSNKSFLDTLDIFKYKVSSLSLIESQCYNFYNNFIVDLPGQEFLDIVDDIFLMWNNKNIRGLKLIPFIPRDGTIFEYFEPACFLTILKIASLSRIYCRDWEIFIDSDVFYLDYENALEQALKYACDRAIIAIDERVTRDDFSRVNDCVFSFN